MILREKVALFSQPGMLPESGLEEMIGKCKDLDMADVHKQVAEQAAEQQANEQQG